MAASKYDFAIEQGSSFKLSLVYKDASGTPIDLSNYCVRIIWKTSTGLLQTFSSTDTNSAGVYRLIVNDEVGKITWLIPSQITNQYNFNVSGTANANGYFGGSRVSVGPAAVALPNNAFEVTAGSSTLTVNLKR